MIKYWCVIGSLGSHTLLQNEDEKEGDEGTYSRHERVTIECVDSS